MFISLYSIVIILVQWNHISNAINASNNVMSASLNFFNTILRQVKSYRNFNLFDFIKSGKRLSNRE